MIIKKGFTLIELLISITIVTILTMVTYAPYNYYQNKAKLKVATREISQILYEGRNMAVNGSVKDSGNVSIGVYFDNRTTEKNKIKIFSYPYDIDKLEIKNEEGGNVKLLKTLQLDKGIEINDVQGMDNILFFYDSITGNLTYYNWVTGYRNKIENEDVISISLSYKNSTSENLRRTLKYFTSTNIIDY